MLAIELDVQVQDAVCRGMVWSHVDVHRLRSRTVVFEQALVFAEGDDLWLVLIVVPAQWVALPGLGQENPPEVGMVFVLDTDQIVRLPLVPRCRRIHGHG